MWFKGDRNLSELDETDAQRLLFFERRATTLWHHMYQLHLQGLLPPSIWYEQQWIIRNIGRRQAVREAWKVFSEGFEQPFRTFVEGQFADADANPPPAS